MSLSAAISNLKNALDTRINSLINSHNTSNSAHSNILATVATTGSYNDLSNKPDLTNISSNEYIINDDCTSNKTSDYASVHIDSTNRTSIYLIGSFASCWFLDLI